MTATNQVTQQPQIENTGAYSLNDLYHARRFIEFYGRQTRYCAELGGFLTWDSRHWSLDKTGQV